MTNTIHIEYLGEVPLYLGLGLQVITSIILGGIVGYDREKKMKSAGLKTNILICLGATLYTVISLLNIENHAGVTDPNRVGAQIVSGIGFLGAGAQSSWLFLFMSQISAGVRYPADTKIRLSCGRTVIPRQRWCGY